MLELVAEYIDKLDTAAENRLLTTKLVPNMVGTKDRTAGCLVGVATGAYKESWDSSVWWESNMHPRHLNLTPTALYYEFNEAAESDPVKTTEFIRNRILENRFAKLEKKELACR